MAVSSSRLLASTALCAVAVLTLSCDCASAAVYTVTQSTDDGSGQTSGSLSWAIQNAAADGDFIQIAPGISSITVTGGSLPSLQADVTIAAEQAVKVTGASLVSSKASSLQVSGASLSQAVTTGLSGHTVGAPGAMGAASPGPDGGPSWVVAGIGQDGDIPLSVHGSIVTSTADLTGGLGGQGGHGFDFLDPTSTSGAGDGGDGGDGGAALNASYSSFTNKGTLIGGAGGKGGSGGQDTTGGTSQGNGGTGGTGGAGATGGHFTLTNRGMISGGGGGSVGEGGTATDGTKTLAVGGAGDGGAGGAGVSGTDITLMNTGTITGGNGSRGGLTAYDNLDPRYYRISNGGGGGSGVHSADSTITNSGTISGGHGGGAGRALTGVRLGQSGEGGIGISGSNTTIVNSGTISGGNGGAPNTTSPLTVSITNGGGGAGVSGSDLTIVNSGAISGGLSGDGKSRANAIEFTSGTNSLELQAGSVITGNVVAGGSSDTLTFGGSANSNFDLSSIGAQYSGFEAYSKNGASTWFVTGIMTKGTSLQDLSVSAGTLDFFGDGTSASTTNLTVDGGTLRVSNGAALTNASGSELVIGSASGSNGTVHVAGTGSTWKTTSSSTYSLTIGRQGAGVLTLSDGGTLSSDGGSGLIQIAGAAGSSGTLNIGAAAGETAAAPGFLEVHGITFGSGAGSVVFNHTNSAYDFNVDVSGAGTLAFYSGGTTLTGDYTNFTGSAEVFKTGALNLTSNYKAAVGLNEGVLFEANSTYENDFIVRSGGTLGGTGSVGSVTVAAGGTLAPGNINSKLTTDEVRFESGSTYQVMVSATDTSGVLVSSGTTDIDQNATVSILASDNGAYQPSATYSIILSSGDLNGEFGTVTDNLAFLDGTLAYLNDDLFPSSVTLTLTRSTTANSELLAFSDLAATPNQKSVADTIEAAGAGVLHDSVQSMRVGETGQGFQQLSGESHSTIHSAGLTSANTSRSSLTRRVITATGGVGASSGDQVSMGFHGEGEVPMLEQLNAQMWGEAFGGWGKVDATATTASVESYGGGFLTGFDAEIIADWRTGVMAGYSRNQFHSSGNGSSGSADSYHLGAYAGTQMGPIGLRLGASFTWHDLATSRDVVFTGFSDHLEADYNASTAQAFAEIGYAFQLASGAFEPFAGLAVINQHTDGFTESGGSAALTSASNNDVMGVTSLGLRGETAIGQLSGFNASLNGSLGWRHAFGDVEPASTMRFASGGNAFSVSGTPIDENTALFEAGLSLEKDETLGLSLSYQGEIGASAQDHSGRLSMLYRF